MRLDRRGVAVLAGVAAGLAALLVLVVLRGPIAEAAATRILAWRGVDASFHVAVFDFDRAVVEGLAVGSAAAPALAARRIEARYNFLALLGGRVRTVTVEGAEIRLTVDGEGARLEGLSLRPGDRRGRPAVTPQVTVTDGRAFVATPAGELAASLEVVGGPEEGWTARLGAHPANITRDGAALELVAGALDAAVVDGALTIDGALHLASLAGAGAQARDVAATVRFAGAFGDAARLDGLVGDGEATLSVDGVTLTPERAARWAELAAPRLTGAAEEILGAHADALRAALSEALGDFSVDAVFAIAAADGRATAAPVGDATVSAANGARLSVAAATDVGGAFAYDTRTGAASARDLSLTASLIGVMDARAIVNTASSRRERGRSLDEATLTLALAPWTADGLTLSADVPRLRVQRGERAGTAELEAELRATGARFGVDGDDMVARLSLSLSWDDHGVVATAREDGLQRLRAARIVAAGRTFDDLDVGVASLLPGEALLRADAAGVRVDTRLRDVGAGTEALGGRWAALLPAAELVVRLPVEGAQEVSAYIQAPRLEGRLEGGDAVLQASVIDADLVLAPDAHARLRFEELSLGGAALPVTVAHAAGELDADLLDGRPRQGRVILAGADVVDTAERARLTPVTVSGDAPIADGVLAGSFVASSREGREVVRADLRHDFAVGDGGLTVATPRLVFAPGSLQPHNVAPILQGPIQEVAGAARLEMRLLWDPAGLRADGAFELDELAFNMRFGRVEGLSTRFEVDDLFALTTAEPQRIEIGLIDPGLPLEDGVVDVELQGLTRTRLVGARFPFADGEVTAAPSEIEWTSDRHLVVLLADGISLNALDEMFKPPNLDVTGSLSGTIPVEARGRSVFITSGKLVSDGPGRVSYTGRAGEGIAQQNESTKLAFDALKNFEYDRLELSLDGDVAGRLSAGVRLEGRNPGLLDGHPINFNLNTTADFADLVTQAFSGLSLSAAPVGAADGAESEGAPQ